jgi:hypothetical protein
MKEKVITIRDPYDVVTARMKVREAARNYGLRLVDQACISMATSSFAYSMMPGDRSKFEGNIFVEYLRTDERIGLKVICQWKGAQNQASSYGNEQWMVDEVSTHQVDDDVVEVCLTKWSLINV